MVKTYVTRCLCIRLSSHHKCRITVHLAGAVPCNRCRINILFSANDNKESLTTRSSLENTVTVRDYLYLAVHALHAAHWAVDPDTSTGTEYIYFAGQSSPTDRSF